MKTKITLGTSPNHLDLVALFFICFLSSLNSFGQKIQTSLTETWKSETWENLSQTFYTYDGNTFLIHDLTQDWDTSWKDAYQTDYTNNPDGTAQQSISQSWDTGTVAWLNVQRTTYAYTAAKKVLTSETEIWSDPDWMLFLKETNTYDGSDYLINSLIQNYDFISPWKNSYQIIYTNNPNGTVSQDLSQRWNVSVWDDTDRTTYTYNGTKIIMSITETWTGVTWENASKDTYDYDGSDYLIHTLSQNWVSGDWKNDSQALITNYGDGSPYQIISQDWDDTGLVWKNVARLTFTYTSLGVKEHVFEKSFAVYPNPAQDKITIRTDYANLGMKYVVLDQMGRQSLNGTITDSATEIDVSQLAIGVYFIQLGQNKNQTIKIVKK
jgi:hypothetical protein